MTISKATSRYGFYYYPDTEHYSEDDANKWIPELQSLGAGWLSLLSPVDLAIPGVFIQRTVEAGINPIIHLPLPMHGMRTQTSIDSCLGAYSQWGVKYLTLFDRPNQLKNWSPATWAQRNLVERFLDIFIPIALSTMKAGLTPVFPPLEPGGDYWDTAFLYSALQGIQRRGQQDLLERMVLSAYAWSGNRSPNWGAGGPESWPQTRPYLTPQNSEDHLGFRIFDWYLAIAEAVLGKSLPIILLGAGSKIGDQTDPSSPAVDIHAHTWQNMTLARIMSGNAQEYDPVPPQVITCNFWVLSAIEGESEQNNAWYKPSGEQLPIVRMIKDWVSKGGVDPSTAAKTISPSACYMNGTRPISHYLLLPSSDWSAKDVHLEAIRPFINKYQPTIGFSPQEASHAKKVTVIGGSKNVPESIIDGLLAAGCIVEQINGDGMNIATVGSTLSHE